MSSSPLPGRVYVGGSPLVIAAGACPLLGDTFVESAFTAGLMISAASGGFAAPPPSPVGLLVEPYSSLSPGFGAGSDTAIPAAAPSDNCTLPSDLSLPASAGHGDAVGAGSVSVDEDQVGGAHGGRVVKAARRGRRRGLGRAVVPRRERVWRSCAHCGHRNHVRRLFCTSCLGSRTHR